MNVSSVSTAGKLPVPITNNFWASRSGKAVCIAAGSFALAGLGALFYATRVETRQYRIETVDLTTGGAGDGDGNGKEGNVRKLRILHLSDLHLIGDDFEKAAFLRQVTDDDYDIIVLTGDIFEKYSGIKYASSLLTRKPKIGAFAVLGNHDHYHYSMFNKTVGRVLRQFRTPDTRRDVTPMVSALKEVGFTVLQNERCNIAEQKLFVVGIDWPYVSEERFQQLAADAPADSFHLCLFHLPKHLEYMSRAGMHLAVGGHTHGGQIRIPGFGAIITDSELSRREASGLLRRGQTAFHISRGLGADPRSNIRFFCPPAVTVLNVEHHSV
jgi:predicted MPP superfamily phosphohydrolase